jgi:hypothetical protein
LIGRPLHPATRGAFLYSGERESDLNKMALWADSVDHLWLLKSLRIADGAAHIDSAGPDRSGYKDREAIGYGNTAGLSAAPLNRNTPYCSISYTASFQENTSGHAEPSEVCRRGD